MSKILIWDLPTRLFHWTFTGLLSASILLALVAGEHSVLFQWHMICGLAAVGLVVLRLAGAFLGSRYARWGSFPLRPGEVVAYFAGILRGNAKRYPGHNPGSALAALAMFALVPALAFTGGGWAGHDGEELHEALAYTLMAVIVAHLLGLALHTLRHRENIGASMVTGRKDGRVEDGIHDARPLAGMVFLVLALLWTGGVFAGHDPRAATVRLPFSGTVVSLGEREGGEGRGEHHGSRAAGRSRDDDHD